MFSVIIFFPSPSPLALLLKLHKSVVKQARTKQLEAAAEAKRKQKEKQVQETSAMYVVRECGCEECRSLARGFQMCVCPAARIDTSTLTGIATGT